MLRKWASNDQRLLATLLPDAVETIVLNLDDHGSIKTLGIQWDSKQDLLQYRVTSSDDIVRNSKLKCLSKRYGKRGYPGTNYYHYICTPNGLVTKEKTRKDKDIYDVFVCKVVKAVHIEVVKGLDSESFIRALKRFIGRRGMPRSIWSDNGIKANKELKELQHLQNIELKSHEVADFLSSEAIEWHYIPPRAPHFGGIWEAVVNCCNYHFKRIIGNSLLAYEELHIISVQIESILNSRPLTPMSEDVRDLSVLTPGHFLIEDSLRSNSEPNLEGLKMTHLSRWQQLQRRTKWSQQSGDNLRIGQLVLVREDNVPLLVWSMGRVTTLCPEEDGIALVAVIKTSRGEVKRPANRLCVLPMNIVE
ncbi:hypothetical protein Trydic_g5522 [Trypoxylus dichotomus]